MNDSTLDGMTSNEADLRAEIAGLGGLEFEQGRESIAQRYGVRISLLDRIRKEECPGRLGEADNKGVPTLEPWPESVDGVELISDLIDVLERFIVLDNYSRLAVVLWVLHAHAHEAADVSPILLLSSPTKGCGKSTLLDVLERLLPRPMMSANASAAVLYRSTHWRPTILVDEADMFLSDDRQIVGFFNAGHRRGVPFRRCQGDDHDVVDFESWCPKALAQIGMPSWPQLIDRSIVVTLQRKRAGQSVKRFRKGQLYPDLKELSRKAVRWAADHLEVLRETEPALPVWFDNRLADNWEPLLAIADAIDEDWAKLARMAAESLGQREEEGREILLLRDLRDLFENEEELPTDEIVKRLVELVERPWADANRGKAITGHWLGKMLGRFGIKSIKTNSDHGTKCRGYSRGQFTEAWAVYLDPSQLPSSEVSQADQVSSTPDPRTLGTDRTLTTRESEGIQPDDSGGVVS